MATARTCGRAGIRVQCDPMRMVRPGIAVAPSVLFAALALGQEPKGERLFDGETLRGWRGDPQVWSVQDGCIVGSTAKAARQGNTFLVWEGDDVADFELSLEFKMQGDNNSGVEYRARAVAGEEFALRGYQCDIHPEPAYVAMLYEDGGRGIIARRGTEVACDARLGTPQVTGELPGLAATDLGQWRRLRIVARGSRIGHELDGVPAVRVDDPWPQAPRKGRLGLQVHGGAPMTVWFRNLVLRRLPTEELALIGEPLTGDAASRIWDERPDIEDAERWFRRRFELRGPVAQALLRISCDNWCEVFVNGERAGVVDDWQRPGSLDVARLLRSGDNVLAFRCRNLGGPAALVAWLGWRDPTGVVGAVVTDGEWRVHDQEVAGWNTTGFDHAGWGKVTPTARVPAGKTCWSSTPESGPAGGDVPPAPGEAIETVIEIFVEAKVEAALPAPVPVPLAPAAQGEPRWLWDDAPGQDEELWFRRTFELEAVPAAAQVTATCDNHLQLFVNGKEVLRSDTWEAPRSVDLRAHLRAGKNVIAAYCANDGGPAGFAARLVLRDAQGVTTGIVSDEAWKMHTDEPDGWTEAAFDDAGWGKAKELGAVGDPALPWSRTLRQGALEAELEDLGPQRAVPAPELRVPDGHIAERLLKVPRSLGSWVCLTADPAGRLYASDQKAGLYRLSLATDQAGATTTSFTKVPVDLEGCQGLCWAFDSLYAVVNGRRSGLYRLRDTDGDDMLDQVTLLAALDGNGEHGPHAVELAPDGRNLLVLIGNHTALPELARSRVPGWAEDALLPRIDDPNGHAVGITAPGGCAFLVDPEGREWELYCCGFRNAYDLAVLPSSEVVTYDSDMEWDMGLPWYRPTRLLHVLSGADYGWRSGSTKWPVDYPDTVPAVRDIGPGSPTGMLPEAHGALLLDWTFGTVYRARITPQNAGLHVLPRDLQEFVVGEPLPVADVVAHAHGCYLLTGGRGLPSTLYRVTLPPKPEPAFGGGWNFLGAPNEAHALRRRLEAFHGRTDPQAVGVAFEHLGGIDPVLRHAARVALESQPVAEWRDRALMVAIDDPWVRLTALLALVRQGTIEDLPKVLAALGPLDFARLDERQRIAWLRVHQLALLRLGEPKWGLRAGVVAALQPLFPTGQPRVDAELCALLCHLQAPEVVERAVPLLSPLRPASPPPWADLSRRNARYGTPIQAMLDAMPPTDQIALANGLRTVAHGWTLEQRAAFFTFLQEARRQKGGASYDGYLKAMHTAAWAQLADAERQALAAFAEGAAVTAAPFRSTAPKGPGRRWQLDEAAALAEHGLLRGRDYQAGRNLFHAVGCASCHRFRGEGGSVGPDLTSLGAKFGFRDVLEATLEPSKVISDQYGGAVLTRKDGSTLFGRVVPVRAGDAVTGYDVWPAVADPQPVRVAAGEVQGIEASKVSVMPAGLVDPLSPAELLDLLAFLLSRGDERAPAFAR